MAKFNARVAQKHDVEENWVKAVNFIPNTGEIIVYDPDNNYTYSRFKIGDGVTKVNDLSFMTDKSKLESLTTSKINVSDIVDNLETASASKVLSANQGVEIKSLINELEE